MPKAKEKPAVNSSTDNKAPATTRNHSVADSPTSDKPRKDNRCRNYTAILYPESAVENWEEVLNDAHVEALVSPLHNRDVNSQGELKKPHYHVMVMYQGNKSKEQAQDFFNSLGATACQTINSIRGEARYLCHLDNPEKEQYDIKDVKEFGGADYQTIIGLPSDKYGILRELIEFIEVNNVLSFSELFRWTAANNERWFRALSDNCAYIVKEYLSSRQYTIEQKLQDKTECWIDLEKARSILSRATPEEEEVPF